MIRKRTPEQDTGTNTGDVTLASVGSAPAAAGASLSGQVLTLQPASGTQPGVVTTGAQTIAGAKTFSSAIGIADGTASAPSLCSTSDSDGSGTGFYRSAADAWSFASNGSAKLTLGGSTRSFTIVGDVLATGIVQMDSARWGGTGASDFTAGLVAPSGLSGVTSSAPAITVQPRAAVDANDLILGVKGDPAGSLVFTVDKEGDVVIANELESTTAGAGVILKSPNGTRYRLTVANGGTLSIAAA